MKSFSLILLFLFIALTGCSNSEDGKYIDGSGTIEATNIILSSKVAGTINKIFCDEGALVKKGDTILIIDHELYDIQLKQATAGKDLADAQLDLANKGARDEDISQAEEIFNQAEAGYKQALADKNRMKNLFESQSITQKQWEDIQTKFRITESQFNASKENLKKIKNITRPEDKKQARANFNKADAAVQLIKKNINDCYLTAPANGHIVKMFFEEGETVTPGASLLKLSDLSKVDLVIYVPEEKLPFIKLGQTAEVIIDAFEMKTFPGSVTYISPEAEFTPKNIQTKDERTKLVFAVKIQILNPDFELKAGLPADAKILLK